MFRKRTNRRRLNKTNIRDVAPDGSGVYEITNRAGDSLYVGQSNDVERRLLEHLRDKDVRGAYEFRTYKPPRGHSAEKYEDKLIRQKRPKKNRRPW